MDISWEDVRLFLAVAEARSMSGGAKALQVGQPTVSRRIGDLEHRLGYPVFERSVAGVTLTPRGDALLGPARNMAVWAAELERSAEQVSAQPRGPVRVTAPPGIAFDFLAPLAAELRQTLPEIRLEVMSSVRYVDLGRREADLALRMRKPKSRDLVVLATAQFENGAYGSKDYVASLPKNYGMRDVDWIAWASPLDALPPNPQLEALVEGFQPAFASDDFLVQIRAAAAGVGAMFLGGVGHRFSFVSSLRKLDLDLGAHRKGALYLVAAKRALEIPRVRSVADAILNELES